MLLHHLLRVHAVHVIGTEHDDVLGVFVVHKVEGLQDGIGGAGEPPLAEALLSRDRGDILPGQAGELPRLRDVAVQRVALVLGEHADLVVSGVHQVGQYKVDEAVVAAEGNRWLGAVSGKRVQALALTASQHNGQDIRCALHIFQTSEILPGALAERGKFFLGARRMCAAGYAEKYADRDAD